MAWHLLLLRFSHDPGEEFGWVEEVGLDVGRHMWFSFTTLREREREMRERLRGGASVGTVSCEGLV